MGLDLGLVLLILAAIGVAHVSTIGAIVGSMILPNPVRQLQSRRSPADWQMEPEGAVIGDGSAAWYFAHPHATHAVLVCHGRSRSKAWMLPLVRALHPQYAVLAIDFPSHGENRYGTTTIGMREAKSVAHGLDWLRRRGHERILVYGVSMGGAAALLSLGENTPPQVEAIVTDGTFDALPSVFDNVRRYLPLPRYLHTSALAIARRIVGIDLTRVQPIVAASSLTIRAHFLHGDRDPLVPTRCAQSLAEATDNGTAEVYPGRHDEPHNPAMQAAVLRFFESVT